MADLDEIAGGLLDTGRAEPTLDDAAASLLQEAPSTAQPTTDKTPRTPRRTQADDAHDAAANADVADGPETETPQDQGDEADELDPFLSLFDDEAAEAAGDDVDDVDEETGEERAYRVTVDGEQRDVTLRELMRSYSGEQAIERRLQEATETRRQATEQASQYNAASQALAARLQAVYENFNQVLIAPRVDPPDPATYETDPIGYLRQEAEYRADQERVRGEAQQLDELLTAARQHQETQRRELINEQAQLLRQAIPKLADPNHAEAFRREVAQVGLALGFTPEEISSTVDHRLLIMAAEAAAFRRMKAQMTKAKTEDNPRIRRRAMPAGGNNRNGADRTRKATAMRKAMAKARETGSVDDVALTLLT